MSIAMFPTFIQDTWTATRPQALVGAQLEAEHIETMASVATESSVTLNRLVEVLADEISDEEGRLGPTQFAFHKAYRLVQAAEDQLTSPPSGSPSVDSEGGLRITWRNGDREVRLVCPPTRGEPLYIYQQWPDGHRLVNEGITGATLADALTSLSGRDTRVASRS